MLWQMALFPDSRLQDKKLEGGQRMPRNVNKKRFVSYKEGAELYSMCQRKFEQMAKDANAIYKLDKLVLVNCDIFEDYLETFRLRR